MKNYPIELADNVIKLRPFKLEDAEEHLAGDDQEQIKWLSGGKSTLEGVQNWIKKNQNFWENDGPVFNFAILDKENKLLGMVEANSDYKTLEGIEKGDANVLYGLYSSARGKGYAVSAVNLMADFLKSKGFHRAVIRVNPENLASLGVPARCGFQEKSVLELKNGEKLIVFVKELR